MILRKPQPQGDEFKVMLEPATRAASVAGRDVADQVDGL
jgi:hypothetical protein